MDNTHVIKEQHKEEAKSQWWDWGATSTGSAFRIRRKLQPQSHSVHLTRLRLQHAQ